MALTLVDSPYLWTLRGQRLLFRVSSTNVAQSGFKYGVTVTDVVSGKQYSFFIDRSPATADLLFDLAPVVTMFNDESTPDMHTAPADNPWDEPQGGSWKSYNVVVKEWWLVDGELTENAGVSINQSRYILNGAYQPFQGYKPSVDAAGDTQLATTGSTSRAWSDRFNDTHTWFEYPSIPSTITTFIPTLAADYGLLYVPLKTSLAGNVTALDILFFPDSGAPYSHTHTLSGGEVIGVGVYPMNLNDSTFPAQVKPAANPNWKYYMVRFVTAVAGPLQTMNYIFYNADRYGQKDCRYDYVRLAWRNSRSGWDYQNFIKKNEIGNELARKQYKQLLMNDSGTFNNWQRQLTDREVLNQQTLTVSSDWIQENEFVFLRNLLVSNQVELLDTQGSKSLGYRQPVSIVDTTFAEKKERNGKLYNITLKLKYSQDYWT